MVARSARLINRMGQGRERNELLEFLNQFQKDSCNILLIAVVTYLVEVPGRKVIQWFPVGIVDISAITFGLKCRTKYTMTFYLITMDGRKTSNQRLVAVKSQRNTRAVINGVARLSAAPPSLSLWTGHKHFTARRVTYYGMTALS